MSERKTPPNIERVLDRFGLELLPEEKLIQVYMRHWIVFARRSWWLGIAILLFLVAGRWMIAQLLEARTDILAPTVLLGLPLGIALIILLFFFQDWRNDALIQTNQRIIHVEKVVLLFKSQQEISLDNIQDVNSSTRGLFARVLQYGHINIETAARGPDIVFGPIPRPRDVQSAIMKQVQAIRAQATMKLMRRTLLHHIDGANYPAAKASPIVGRRQEPQSALGKFFQLLYPPNPRVEGNQITWYKHRIFLLRRLLVPILLLLTLIGGAFFFPSPDSARPLWAGWGVAVALVILLLAVNYQIWLGDIYVLTTDMIIDITRTPFGLFGGSRRAANLGRIQNITFRQPGLLSNILRFGDVRIQTAGEDDFTFNRVPRPEEVQGEIQQRLGLYRQREEQRKNEELASWLTTFQQINARPLVLATVDSVAKSGLLQAILFDLDDKYQIRVQVRVAESGTVLAMGRQGIADALLVNDYAREMAFIKEGCGLGRYNVMFSDYVIVGPKTDPADIRSRGVRSALLYIATKKSPFISRGDHSATHRREQKLWQEADVDLQEEIAPGDTWYSSLNQSMGDALLAANGQKAYTLSDRVTYLLLKESLPNLDILVEGTSGEDRILLYNPYAIIPVHPGLHPAGDEDQSYDYATTFSRWITSPEIQEIIAGFGQDKYGQPLFQPNSDAWKEASK